MRKISLIAAGLIFAAILAVPAFAQTSAAKIALINTVAFEDTNGITKMINARKALENEFKVQITELEGLGKQIQALQAELNNIKKTLEGPAPANKDTLVATYNTKYDELDKKTREYKFKEETLKASYDRREQVVMGPVMQDVGKAMDEYSKSKGFTIMLDLAKLYNAGAILYWDETTNVTTDFIKFYNARPATATTTK